MMASAAAGFTAVAHAGTAEPLPAADAASHYDPLVKMRLERPAGRDKRQYKNNISFKYAQSEAEGILNGQITWNKKNFR